jgi:hypothetical protein
VARKAKPTLPAIERRCFLAGGFFPSGERWSYAPLKTVAVEKWLKTLVTTKFGKPKPLTGAYDLLFSFSTPEEKDHFLDLVCSNPDMGND